MEKREYLIRNGIENGYIWNNGEVRRRINEKVRDEKSSGGRNNNDLRRNNRININERGMEDGGDMGCSYRDWKRNEGDGDRRKSRRKMV